MNHGGRGYSGRLVLDECYFAPGLAGIYEVFAFHGEAWLIDSCIGSLQLRK